MLDTCADTLAELDRLLPALDGGALGDRPGAAGHHTHGPVDLRALVARMRAAGLPVDLEVDDGSVTTTVYRVVQEALTNVLRHAPGARAGVRVAAADGHVRVSVVDDGPGWAESARRGYGLAGLAERVAQDGGTLRSGAGPDGSGFRVVAEVPLAARAAVADAPGWPAP